MDTNMLPSLRPLYMVIDWPMTHFDFVDHPKMSQLSDEKFRNDMIRKNRGSTSDIGKNAIFRKLKRKWTFG